MVEIRISWSLTVESLIAPLAVQLKRNGGTVEEQRRNCVNNCVWVGGMICVRGKVWSRSRPRSQEENRAYSTLLSRFKRLLVLLKDTAFYNHRCNVKWFKQLIHGLQFCWKSPIFLQSLFFHWHHNVYCYYFNPGRFILGVLSLRTDAQKCEGKMKNVSSPINLLLLLLFLCNSWSMSHARVSCCFYVCWATAPYRTSRITARTQLLGIANTSLMSRDPSKSKQRTEW